MDYVALRGRTHESNRRFITKRKALSAAIWIAEKYQDFEALYFPHVLDWRGRMYPVSAYVNPQSDDSGKALLEFANGAALGEEGAFWLAVHGANCFGIDKVPFEQRVAWVEQNQDAILDSAVRPLEGSRLWADADDPYLFLAFCMEWAGLMAHVARGEPQDTFVSHLPVSWDGSCNGLQNFSAMLRDPIGGAATNLVPSDTPADIYQRVAEVASVQVDKDAAKGEVNAAYWVGKVTRKIAKRPTMTLPYGSGRYGFREQLREELDKIRLEDNKPYIEGDEFLCSLYMANTLYDALGQVVVAARQAMDWLQEVASVASQENLPLWWTTPAGMRVMQDYKETKGLQVSCTLSGKRVQMTLQVETEKLDKRKQEQGISPNFVHSLDAAHLMRTVTKCVAAGIGSFAMVHDSYGTHAGNAGALRDMLREAFVEQYSREVLEEFRRELAEQLSPALQAKLPPVPPTGTLDLSAVNRSEYFFA
jgi:DNA-directed RNA polymerase